jgi:hypothetical protein
MRLHEGDQLALRGGVFTGCGWGRRARSRKLLPLALALIDRGSWPSRILLPLFYPGFGNRRQDEDGGIEVAWVAVRSSRRGSYPLRSRMLEVMTFGGVRSRLARASSGQRWQLVSGHPKIRHVELAGLARSVQRDYRRLGPAVDAELAIDDAAHVLFDAPGARPPPESNCE